MCFQVGNYCLSKKEVFQESACPKDRLDGSWLSPCQVAKTRLTLPMRGLLLSKVQGCKDFHRPSKPCCVGIHWIALAECSRVSTHVPGFQSFFRFLHHSVMYKISHQQHKR